ncbi:MULTISPECIES: LacI family DNA-binding transcriptional regulator [unclassified Aureimonas]|uniref:LacI family DNA-binding transcriptional regulator n=1 Tax=unclassified Aureimonas TaxID=2615206 RepID=UPI0006FA9040|nr:MULTISPECIES: LacI family DNA-binding transcriptional regulator [unclassified Aureimonas]KQT64267.1 LacI family transcriptional regulator [Aureimonas sp. Leaf427]KQT81456.1 LacI family transcriptional regulator [Aureimonas sp. Leaf460]
MGGTKPTLGDVARVAAVSLATVDRVLNGRGGVAPDKEARILAAARALRLDRALAHRPQRRLRVAVLMQAPKNPFHAALKVALDRAAPLFAEMSLQFFVHHIDPNDPRRIAETTRSKADAFDGLVVVVPDEPDVAEALRAAASRRPVVTLATDVPSSGRAAYVGPDDRRSGRVAGDLFGRFLGPEGGRIAMLAGSRAMTGHREREAGLREVFAERYAGAGLGPVLESGEDADRAGRLVFETFLADPGLRGLYHSTAGAGPAMAALRRLGRDRDTVVVMHELTADRRRLLRDRAIDAVIDQDPELEMRVAMETMARLLSRLEGEAATLITDVRIHMAENA